MKKILAIVLTVGILLRVFLSMTTYHADVAALGFAGKIISQGNISNFYDFLGNLPEDDPYLAVYPKDLFIYPPTIYFLNGLFAKLTNWMISPEVLNNFTLNFTSTLGNSQLNLYLLLLKLPYFAFDIASVFVLMALFKDEKKKMLAFIVWIFNPVSIYATYMMGQFDIIPTFFVILAMYLAMKREKIYLASLMLGIGMSFKIYPLLFLIPLALTKDKWIDRIKVFVLGILPYILSVLPFIFSKGFRASALVAGQTTKSLYAILPISGGESIMIYLAAIIFVYIVFLFSENKLENLWQKFFIISSLFFIFTHYHPQWFTWITSFIIIDLVKNGAKRWPIILLALVSWLGLVTFFDPGLTTWLFAPLVPNLWGKPGLWELVGVNLDINIARSYLQTVFAAVGFYYIYNYFPRKNENIAK